MRLLRILFGILGWVLILCLLALAGVVALVTTEQGTRWLFDQAERHAPVEFRFESVEGTLFRGLSLAGLQVDAGGTRVQLERGRIQVDALPLLQLTLRIRELTLAGARVDLPEADPEPPEATTPFELPEAIEIPLRLALERFSLTDLRLFRAGETLLELDRLALRLEASPQTLRVTGVELAMLDIEAALDAELHPAGDYPLRLDGHWRFVLPEALATSLDAALAEGMLTVEGSVRGPLRAEHRLEAGIALDTQLLLEDLLESPRIALENTWTPFRYGVDPERVVEIDSGELTLAGGPDDWRLEALAAGRIDDLPPVRLLAALGGSTQQVVIETLSLRSDAGRIDLQGQIGLDEVLDWALEAEVHDVYSQMLGLELDAVLQALSVTSSGRLPLTPDVVLASLLPTITANLEIEELRAQLAGQSLSGGGGLRVQRGVALIEDLHLLLGPQGRLQLNGEADLGTETPFQLSLAADALDLGFLVPDRALSVDRLRLGAEGMVALDTGSFSAEVALSELGARVDGQEIAARAALGLTEAAAEVRDLSIVLPADGLLAVTGRVSYTAGIEWEIRVSGRDIDPGVILPDFPGRLALDLRSHGALPPEDVLRAEVELTELSGMLRGQPLDGVATLALNGTRVQVDRLDLGMGANRLSASGSIDEELDLSLTLDAPELDRILPELAGRIRLDASLGGVLESPTIRARGEGAGLRYGEFGSDTFSLRLDAGLDPEAPAELALRLSGIRAGATTIPELRADAEGRASAHRLTLAVDAADMGRVELRAAGGYDLDRSLWDGRLERLDLSQPLAGDWSLQQPAGISAGPERARLGELCIGREQSRICAEGEWDAAAGAQGQASIQDLDLAWLSPFLPPETAFDGRLDARAQATMDPEARLRAELALPPAAGTLRFELADGTPQTVPYSDLRVTVRVDDRSVDADAGLSFLEDGELSANVRLRPDGENYRIDGRLQAGLESLGWAGALSPAIQDVRGRLRGDIELGGLLNAPLVSGGIRLEEAGVTIPEAGIELEVPLLQAEVVSAEEMRLIGEIRSGDAALNLEGELGFPDQRPRAEIRIRGERFLAVDRPDIRARISPDLTVSFVPERLTVRGEILVPSALIRPPDLPPGSVTVSRDEVIIGEEDEPGTGLPMDIRVRVILGDDVRFDGFDLEARVTGDLDVIDLPGRPLQVFGNVEIPEGRYEAWGQDLTLERGLVIFQGPVENPALDLRAVRRVPAYNVVVGVEIGGTPEALQSRITSEPPMDDTEAMAFLLTGRPLSGAGEREGNLIAGAAAAWGLEQAGLITQRLGSELGLDVELDADDGLDQSALTIGTYLSPRLLLRYSVGLFDGSNRIMLRYELTRSLSVESTSSADGQGIDLIYRIER
jgi:translocation and assembly module TamB